MHLLLGFTTANKNNVVLCCCKKKTTTTIIFSLFLYGGNIWLGTLTNKVFNKNTKSHPAPSLPQQNKENTMQSVCT